MLAINSGSSCDKHLAVFAFTNGIIMSENYRIALKRLNITPEIGWYRHCNTGYIYSVSCNVYWTRAHIKVSVVWGSFTSERPWERN